MNITSGIKLKKFNSKQNKKMMKSQESIIKKEKCSKPTKISPLFSHKKKNMENQTKTPDKKTNFKPNLTHEFFFNQDNNNKMLSKFILQEKKDKINNSTMNKNQLMIKKIKQILLIIIIIIIILLIIEQKKLNKLHN